MRSAGRIIRTMSDRKLGSYRATPEWWKARVRAELKRRGHGSRSELAEFVPCATSAISQLLRQGTPERPSQETSRIAARVAEWTGVPLPDEDSFDDLGDVARDLRRLRDISPSGMKAAREMVRALLLAEEKARKPD